MKRSMTSPPATRQHAPLSLSDDNATHNHASYDAYPNVTLSDIYKKLVELLAEVAKQRMSRKAIRLPDVKELTGESRSQIYARMNPKYPAYDQTWPLPFYIGKSPRWWLHEVEAWLAAQAVSTTIRH